MEIITTTSILSMILAALVAFNILLLHRTRLLHKNALEAKLEAEKHLKHCSLMHIKLQQKIDTETDSE